MAKTMCDTMTTTSSVEGGSSYVLTQDMIDAAMTEQFTYQDDIESEEDYSSPNENNMELEADSQSHTHNLSNTTENSYLCNSNERISSEETDVTMSRSQSPDTTPTNVVIIETGLDRRPENEIVDISEKDSNFQNEDVTDNNNSIRNNLGLERDISEEDQEIQMDSSKNKTTSNDSEKNIHILKKILSEPSNIESIDLCDSDETFSENETSEVGLIDNDLKSVMESNLMAEVGMNKNKHKPSPPVTPPTDSSPPKIKVKSITQISSTAFNNMSRNEHINENTINGQYPPANNKTGFTNHKTVEDVPFTQQSSATICKEQAATPMHINKIAIPHHTLVNNQGPKMKCVYMKKQPKTPVIFKSKPVVGGNKTVKVTVPQQIKKPIKLSPIQALSNVTQRHLQFYQPGLQSVVQETKQLAPKLQRAPVVPTVPLKPDLNLTQQDLKHEPLIKSLLFQRVKPPYVPPEGPAHYETYHCLDCNDRFYIEASLHHHLARRSLVICYWCSHCRAEVTFYNKCVFLKHLRSHNFSPGHINYANITVSPLPIDMIEAGVITSFFKDTSLSFSRPREECILPKAGKDMFENFETTKKSNSSIIFIDKPISSIKKLNSPNQITYGKLAPVAPTRCVSTTTQLQSKSYFFVSQPCSSTNTSPVLSTKSLMSANSRFSGTQNLQTSSKMTSILKKPEQKSVLLLSSKSSVPNYIKSNCVTNTNLLPPNEVFTVSESLISVEDCNPQQTLNPEEEEEIDVESVVETNNAKSVHPLLGPESEKNTARNTKRKEFKSVQDKRLSKEPLKPLKRTCSECGAQCMNINKHLNGSNRPSNPLLACEHCKLILPTKCALKIHTRIHTKAPPYKCPDCGKDFDEWKDLNAHLKFSCGHLAKCVQYLCVSCKDHFPSEALLGHHIAEVHSRDIFRCSVCPVAFYNKNSLEKHLLIHPDKVVLGINQKQCSLCPKKLVPIDDYLNHVQEHARSSFNLIYAYRCPLCSGMFGNKMGFIIHQIKEKREQEGKGDVKTKILGSLHSTSLPNLLEENGKTDQVIVHISDSDPDFEEETETFRLQDKFQEADVNCPSVTEKDPLSLDGWEAFQEQRVQEKREELCIVCKKNYVYLLPGIDLNEQSLCCKQCVKPLDYDSAIVNGKTHRSGSPSWSLCSNRSVSTDSNKGKITGQNSTFFERYNVAKKRRSSDFCSNDSSLDTELTGDFGPIKKKSRKKPSKDATGRTYMQGQVIAKSPDVLACLKCEFVADNKETFLDHIVVHRTDPHTYQCLECGLCFVVLPSLERHLQMHHGVKDVKDYIMKNKSCLPQKSVSIEESIELEDNQCRVCFQVFGSSTSLEKHFRTHGMAFMSTLSKSP